MSELEGWLATGPAESAAFWRTAFDASGTLLTPRVGVIWDAVATANDSGHRGGGRLIAIIDGYFDPVALPADRIHPSSEWGALSASTEQRHGTIVARLIHTIVPDATLLLLNVMRDDRLSPSRVAAAISRAVALGADVVNLSLEFPSDCAPRAMTPADPEVLFGVDPDPDAFLAVVDEWLRRAEPYEGARCARSCAVCTALAAVPASTVVIAAAGNARSDSVCPACFRDVVGAGFLRAHLTVVDGNIVAGELVLPNPQNLLQIEIGVEVPPGFEATSFASPLIAGLAALADNPGEFRSLVPFWIASTPLTQLRDTMRVRPDAVTERAIRTLDAGLRRFAATVPPRHQHWSAGREHPCAPCALLLLDWYLTWVSLLVNTSSPDAVMAARQAVTVAPHSAMTWANLGVALREASRSAESSESAALQAEARISFENATRRTPDETAAAFYRSLAEELKPGAPA